MKRITQYVSLGVCILMSGTAFAHAPSGAIFTTTADGDEVNLNIFPSKEAVYLDGGPGPGAPQTAAGLDDGTYVFQVTDPSGRNLLSTDAAKCRQFVVVDGVIAFVVATGCEHLTGFDIDYGATTVQLMPYLDTPNPGGVYKVWISEVGDFLMGCTELGVANGLDVVDCGRRAGNQHGFVPGHTKTDNFKVRGEFTGEIDARFINAETGEWMLGYGILWTDTVGGQNRKWSYYAPELLAFNEAHIEAIEVGTHYILVTDQPGCQVHDINLNIYHSKGITSQFIGVGEQLVTVRVSKKYKQATYAVEVDCH